MTGAETSDGASSPWRDADYAPWMITLPAGQFTMGASEGDKFANDTERPVQAVTLAAFALGRAPVTVTEFRAFNPDHAANDDPQWPVAGVSWEEASAYCTWLSKQTQRSYRLPTEAEWEYACRAGTRTPFSTGAELTAADANFLYTEDGARIGPGNRTRVGSYPANAFGFHDFHGNVCEWVADAWRPSLVEGRAILCAASSAAEAGTTCLDSCAAPGAMGCRSPHDGTTSVSA